MTRALSAWRASGVAVTGVAVTLIALVGSASQAIAAKPPPPDPVFFDLPAGVACAGFDLRIEILSNLKREMKTFTDKNGNVVRTLEGGKGDRLTFTNLATSLTLTLKPNGSVQHVTINRDGTETWVTTGHNVLILFPTDVPAGPSTTQYVGRVVFTVVTATQVFTLQSVSGTSTNICAALT